MVVMGLLAGVFKTFSGKHPLVTYDLFTANADLVKEQMEKGLIDLGVLLEPVDIGKFEFIRLNKKERWVVLMRPDDPLAKKERISADDLCGLPLILPRRLSVQNELASWFGDRFRTLKVLFTSNLNTNGALMVQAGLAYSVVIEGSVSLWDQNKMIFRPLYPELSANSVLAWKREQPFSFAVTKFIEYLKTSDALNQ